MDGEGLHLRCEMLRGLCLATDLDMDMIPKRKTYSLIAHITMLVIDSARL